MSVFESQSFDITRPGGASAFSAASGRMTKPSTVTTPATGNVQPASGKDIDRLPEGLRTHETILIMSTSEIIPNDIISAIANLDGSTSSFANKTFKINHLDGFGGHVSVGRYEAIATREPGQGNT